jgi:hypothetical protein
LVPISTADCFVIVVYVVAVVRLVYAIVLYRGLKAQSILNLLPVLSSRCSNQSQ